jgi:hypothetical protein
MRRPKHVSRLVKRGNAPWRFGINPEMLRDAAAFFGNHRSQSSNFVPKDLVNQRVRLLSTTENRRMPAAIASRASRMRPSPQDCSGPDTGAVPSHKDHSPARRMHKITSQPHRPIRRSEIDDGLHNILVGLHSVFNRRNCLMATDSHFARRTGTRRK